MAVKTEWRVFLEALLSRGWSVSSATARVERKYPGQMKLSQRQLFRLAKALKPTNTAALPLGVAIYGDGETVVDLPDLVVLETELLEVVRRRTVDALKKESGWVVPLPEARWALDQLGRAHERALKILQAHGVIPPMPRPAEERDLLLAQIAALQRDSKWQEMIAGWSDEERLAVWEFAYSDVPPDPTRPRRTLPPGDAEHPVEGYYYGEPPKALPAASEPPTDAPKGERAL